MDVLGIAPELQAAADSKAASLTADNNDIYVTDRVNNKDLVPRANMKSVEKMLRRHEKVWAISNAPITGISSRTTVDQSVNTRIVQTHMSEHSKSKK